MSEVSKERERERGRITIRDFGSTGADRWPAASRKAGRIDQCVSVGLCSGGPRDVSVQSESGLSVCGVYELSSVRRRQPDNQLQLLEWLCCCRRLRGRLSQCAGAARGGAEAEGAAEGRRFHPRASPERARTNKPTRDPEGPTEPRTQPASQPTNQPTNQPTAPSHEAHDNQPTYQHTTLPAINPHGAPTQALTHQENVSKFKRKTGNSISDWRIFLTER